MLIELDHDLIVSTNQIAEVEGLTGDRIRVTFGDGRTRVVNTPMDTIRRQMGTIIPAPPGYAMIRGTIDPEGEYWWVDPVIAFRDHGTHIDGPLQPITDEGEPSDTTTWGLVKPSGAVVDFDRFYADIEEYKQARRDEYAKLTDPPV